ncbi:MAG: hypothetical protein M1831_003652 [Alyxoria varia]|nr:MAG: hypothetical protein M1831_003652 [Alyxoria varia]
MPYVSIAWKEKIKPSQSPANNPQPSTGKGSIPHNATPLAFTTHWHHQHPPRSTTKADKPAKSQYTPRPLQNDTRILVSILGAQDTDPTHTFHDANTPHQHFPPDALPIEPTQPPRPAEPRISAKQTMIKIPDCLVQAAVALRAALVDDEAATGEDPDAADAEDDIEGGESVVVEREEGAVGDGQGREIKGAKGKVAEEVEGAEEIIELKEKRGRL